MIGERIVTVPSYTVTVEEENQVHLIPEVDLTKAAKQVSEVADKTEQIPE